MEDFEPKRQLEPKGTGLFSVNLETAIRGFDIDNIAAQKAIDKSKALHARRWQTKEDT